MQLRIWLVLALSANGANLSAGTNRFSAGTISRSEPSTNITRALWHPSGRQVTYLRPFGNAKHTTNALCAYDIASGRETILYVPPSGTNQPALSLSSYQWSPRGDVILVTGDDDLWLIPVPVGPARRLTHDKEPEELSAFSPDGARIAFVRGNNLFVIDTSSGRSRQLTFDGSDTILNGTLDWVYEEEFSSVTGSARSYEWSPDGKRLVFLRLDQQRVPEHPITDFLRTHPTVKRQRYPKAGDSNSIPSIHVVDVTASKPRARMMPLDLSAEYVVPEFSWTPDSRGVAVMTLNRAQNELSVFVWEPSARKPPRLLFQEKTTAWLNIFDPPRFLDKVSDDASSPDVGGSAARSTRAPPEWPFLWLSERDGWLHCHLFNADATPRRQLTRGAWQIEPNLPFHETSRPFEIDPDRRWLYFSSTEPDPRERHIYRARLDGSGLERLTHEPGTHFQKLSPDGRHLLESFSSVDHPPALRLLRNDGTLLATLDQREDRWKDFATARAEFHEVIAPDGAKLYAKLIKPAGFDPARKYPLIVDVYGGPHAQVVRNQWPATSSRQQLLAQEGFLIWSLDNRGSWGRGRAWETAVFKNLGTNELADQLAGVAYLKTLPFVDASRLAISGWSYGGYMTLYALTHAPDVFKCGVAGAPVTDWKFYDTIYTERYMRTPKENPIGYKTSSPLAAADKLKAKLLIIHGTADDNVHLHNTMNFIDALIKAGRPYELQIQPGQMHGFGGESANQFLNEQIVDFFKRNL